MKPLSDTRIIDSWLKNAAMWTIAVRNGEIESRQRVTNQAIVEAVRSRTPHSGLDIGCGEGWLVRELAEIEMIGVDVVPGFIEAARGAGGGDYRLLSYEELVAGALKVQVDVAICNFSLFAKESVEAVFRAVPSLLNPGGTFIVQTLHPLIACGALPYQDGWREGSWAGFREGFTDPAPWYFRTLESWKNLYTDCGFSLQEIREPVHPTTGKPVSIIFIGEVTAQA